MNDIINAADANNIRLYADDTGIFLHWTNIYNLINHVRNCFRRIKQWCVCNKLASNDDNSYFSGILLTNLSPKDFASGDTIIKWSRTVKYIALHIDELLNWKTHIAYLNESLIKLFGIFNQSNDYVSVKLARQIHYSFVYSRISYNIDVYGSCAKASLERA